MDHFEGTLCVDIETSSAFDLKNGAWAYSLHPSTIVYCVCFGYAESRDGPRQRHTWLPGSGGVKTPEMEEIFGYLWGGGELLAHNASFEKAIFANILGPSYRFPRIDVEQWRDTQQLGLAVNYPLALMGLAKALGCPTQKDMGGNKLMKKMAKAEPDGPMRWKYDRDREHVKQLIRYCEVDVDTTLDCYYRLPKLSVTEALIARTDDIVNERGMWLDQGFASKCAAVAAERATELADETFVATGGELLNSTAAPSLKTYLTALGVELPKVRRKSKKTGKFTMTPTADKNAVAGLLDDDELPDEVRVVLENRVEANKATSLAKLQRVPLMVGADGRLRDALHYCGAHTGRWTSSGLQVHNLPKDRMGPGEGALVRCVLALGSLDGLKMAQDRPLDAISQSLRSVVAAPPGRDLIAADFSAIEARVIAWLAGQQDVLDLFAAGEDVYVHAARIIGSSSRNMGKIATLALGFGMGALKLNSTAAGWGVHQLLKESYRIQKLWRRGNARIVAFWAMIETAVREAITDPNNALRVGKLLVIVRNNVLFLRLPSGRSIRYYRPHIVPSVKEIKVVLEDGTVETREMKTNEIRFFTMGKDKKSMQVESTYGGKLAENATQAVARDMLAEAMVRCERTDPYDVVIHVHDSIAAEVPGGAGDVDEFCGIMAAVPTWGEGLPIAVEGYRGKRFRG